MANTDGLVYSVVTSGSSVCFTVGQSSQDANLFGLDSAGTVAQGAAVASAVGLLMIAHACKLKVRVAVDDQTNKVTEIVTTGDYEMAVFTPTIADNSPYASRTHNHDGVYAPLVHNHNHDALQNYNPTHHTLAIEGVQDVSVVAPGLSELKIEDATFNALLSELRLALDPAGAGNYNAGFPYRATFTTRGGIAKLAAVVYTDNTRTAVFKVLTTELFLYDSNDPNDPTPSATDLHWRVRLEDPATAAVYVNPIGLPGNLRVVELRLGLQLNSP